MRISLNGEPHAFEGGSLDALLASLSLSSGGVAVAVNRQVVPRAALPTTTLRPGDAVEIVRASPGG